MGETMRVVLIAALALLTSCAQVAENTAKGKYLATWNDRLDGYRSQFVSQDAALRKEIAEGTEKIFASGTADWTRLVSPVMAYSVKIRDAFTVAGRGETTRRFIAHIQTNPTPGLTEVWFQTQVADLQQQARAVDEETKLFLASLNDRVQVSPEWILQVEQLARRQGMVAGTVQELPLLFQNARSYYTELRQIRAQEQYLAEQRSQALLGVLTHLNQLNYQQQMIDAITRPRTCQRIGTVVTCY